MRVGGKPKLGVPWRGQGPPLFAYTHSRRPGASRLEGSQPPSKSACPMPPLLEANTPSQTLQNNLAPSRMWWSLSPFSGANEGLCVRRPQQRCPHAGMLKMVYVYPPPLPHNSFQSWCQQPPGPKRTSSFNLSSKDVWDIHPNALILWAAEREIKLY